MASLKKSRHAIEIDSRGDAVAVTEAVRVFRLNGAASVIAAAQVVAVPVGVDVVVEARRLDDRVP